MTAFEHLRQFFSLLSAVVPEPVKAALQNHKESFVWPQGRFLLSECSTVTFGHGQQHTKLQGDLKYKDDPKSQQKYLVLNAQG